MTNGTQGPTLAEMQKILTQAARCLDCDAPECFEFTPEGVDACAGLPYWNGRPVDRSTLTAWQQELSVQQAKEN